MRALLDVSALLALFDVLHVHHTKALAWWARDHQHGWATCPLTENGFVRVATSSGYSNPFRLNEAMAGLRKQISLSDHAFWPDDVSIADAAVFNHARMLGPRQITDVYLLAIAVKNGGRLVTFDRGIPLAAIRGAEARHLVVI
jgi:toxin-antitoxin system PIN domain toxin